MKLRIYIAICALSALFFFSGQAFAQDKNEMSRYQGQLQSLFDKVFNAATDNERYNANEQVVQLFSEALSVDNSFFWKWDFGTSVSVLSSSDKKFKVISWPVVRDNGEYECFGFVQAYDEKDEEYQVYVLNDMSDEIMNAQESLLGPENWLGAVYQELVETKYDGKVFYTLIGWTGVNSLVQRKVIEPIYFRSGGSRPQFGQALFRREKNLRRIVLEYSRTAMVNVHYDEQYTRTVVNKKVKGKKGRVYNVQENVDTKEKMILFDEIAPMIPGMEGLPHCYVPTGIECALIFREGKWELNSHAQGRSNDSRLNKEFSPLPKTDPSYKVGE